MLDRVSFGARPPNLFAVIAGLDLAIMMDCNGKISTACEGGAASMVKPAHDAESVVHTIGE